MSLPKLISETEETLVLTQDVANPKADRRFKRNWMFEPVWEAGTKFVVTTKLYERTRDKELLEVAQSVVDKLVALGEEIPEEAASQLECLKVLVGFGPTKDVVITKRGTYDRLAAWADDDRFPRLMEALKPAKKDMKDVLGDYSSPDWGGGPAAVLQQLVDNGTLTFKQIERAVAELDPDHTVLDSIVMATADEEPE
jgi:predicted flap endonuclease-1-like 5' DNA nuclease